MLQRKRLLQTHCNQHLQFGLFKKMKTLKYIYNEIKLYLLTKSKGLIFSTIKIVDDNNKIMFTKVGQSFVANFLQFLYRSFNTGVNVNFDVSVPFSSSRNKIQLQTATFTTFSSLPSVAAPSNSSDYGIILGVGTTPITATNYAVEGKIFNGSGSGQLIYGAMTGYGGVTITDNTSSVEIRRNLVNSSGATINVTRLGLVASAGGVYFLIYLDEVNFSIPAGGSVWAEIIFSITT